MEDHDLATQAGCEHAAALPDHRPERYFCKSWSALIVRSQEFEVRKVKGTPERNGVTWYRNRSVGA